MVKPHPPDSAPIALDAFPAPALPALFGAAIGAVGAKRYLPLFTQFESLEPCKPRWNWAACLCTFNWLIWRRLWLPAGLYAVALLVLPLLLVGVGRLFLHGSTAVEVGLLLILAVLALALPALLGDRLLYQHCRSAITRALERAPTLEAACTALAQGAPSQVWLRRQIGVNVLLTLLLLAGLGYWTWPTTPKVDATDSAPIPIQRAATVSAAASATTAAAASATVPLSAPAANPASGLPSTVGTARAVTVPDTALTVVVHAPTVASAPPPQAPAPLAGAYHVNVGLFADPDNARRAYIKLVKAGLPAQRQVLLLRGHKLTRVRVGPFTSRAMANAAVAPIRQLQLDAVLDKRR